MTLFGHRAAFTKYPCGSLV